VMLCQKRLHKSCRMGRRVVVMKLICSLGHCERDGHTVHKLSQRRLTADWLAPRESDSSRMHSKVSSDWLPSYIKATRPVLEIFKMAEYFLDSPRMYVTTEDVWTESEFRICRIRNSVPVFMSRCPLCWSLPLSSYWKQTVPAVRAHLHFCYSQQSKQTPSFIVFPYPLFKNSERFPYIGSLPFSITTFQLIVQKLSYHLSRCDPSN
jgi:hypothetical protein